MQCLDQIEADTEERLLIVDTQDCSLILSKCKLIKIVSLHY